MLCRELRLRELGMLSAGRQRRRVALRRLSDLKLSSSQEVDPPHKAPISCLDVECRTQRFMLSGCYGGLVALYDLRSARPNSSSQPGTARIVRPRHTTKSRSPSVVTSCQWYPPDAGLFVTTARNGCVSVWDAARPQRPVETFELSFAVEQGRMSHCGSAAVASLIAVCGDGPDARLCDMASGGCLHTLSGHVGGVRSVDWSASDEFVLATGSGEGCIRLWDVRKTGRCLYQLDRHRGPQDPPVERHAPTPRDWGRAHGVGVARAHTRPVSNVRFLACGRRLLSCDVGGDMNLWDTDRGCNLLVNYGRGSAGPGRIMARFALGPGRHAPLIACPDGAVVRVLNSATGRLVQTLRGHFEPVLAASYRGFGYHELFTAGRDREILWWRSAREEDDAMAAAEEAWQAQFEGDSANHW